MFGDRWPSIAAPVMKSKSALWDPAYRRTEVAAAGEDEPGIGWQENRSSPRKTVRGPYLRPWRQVERVQAARSILLRRPAWTMNRVQRQDHVVAGRDQSRPQHGMKYSVSPLARLRVWQCAQPSFCEQKYSVPSSAINVRLALARNTSRPPGRAMPSGRRRAAVQGRRMHGVQRRADVIVARDLRHAEQRMAVRGLAPVPRASADRQGTISTA